jgi:hypothetical protein
MVDASNLMHQIRNDDFFFVGWSAFDNAAKINEKMTVFSWNVPNLESPVQLRIRSLSFFVKNKFDASNLPSIKYF